MKATLEFNLPEDYNEHRIYLEALQVRVAVNELLNDLRNWRKHGHTFTTPDAVIDKVRQQLLDSLPPDYT